MDYILLRIQDKVKIEGESTLKDFEKCIEIHSFNHGVIQPMMSAISNTGRTTGRPNLADLVCTKKLDATTPALNIACLKATNLGTVKLHLMRQDTTGGNNVPNAIEYMRFEMTQTMISSLSVGGGGAGLPTETLSLNFDKMTWTYIPQKEATGAAGNIATSWEQSTNTPGSSGK